MQGWIVRNMLKGVISNYQACLFELKKEILLYRLSDKVLSLISLLLRLYKNGPFMIVNYSCTEKKDVSFYEMNTASKKPIMNTLYPGSLVQFILEYYYMKLDKTSWTYDNFLLLR